MSTARLVEIPLVDIRHAGIPALAMEYEAQAKRLLRVASANYGKLLEYMAPVALKLSDRASRKWLQRTENPYLPQLDALHAQLGKIPGLYTFNLSYEWGCTTGIRAEGESNVLLRTLDWPLPELGTQLVVAHEAGAAGDYYNITWPGLVGVYTAMAPGRFAVAINQAPRRQPTGVFAVDWALERSAFLKKEGMPPSHLLRHVCAHAEHYDAALKMLIHTPLCMPAIFTITGVGFGEGCIVERLEKSAYTRPLAQAPIATANHWVVLPTAARWAAREPDSFGRKGALEQYLQESDEPGELFGWLEAPVLHADTRLAACMDARHGQLQLLGFEAGKPATALFML